MGKSALVYGDSRRKAGNLVHVRWVHLAEKLGGERRKRFYVSALAFGKNGVKRQTGFPRTGHAGKNNQFVFWNFQIDVFKIMNPRPFDNYFVVFFHQSLY